MAKAKKTTAPLRTNTEVRSLLLRYFYERNANATSRKGKRGSSVKISDVKKELKAKHGLTQPEVQANLTYLLSENWVEEIVVRKEFRAQGGTLIPSETAFFGITAAGIDKIEGPGEFTMTKFHGINISATGQNIITLGDGNQINANFRDLGKSLADLRDGITKSSAPEETKLGLVADIETIQSQLAKPQPTQAIIAAAWATAKVAATIDGCASLVHQVAGLIAPFIS
jgi:hypothetical protein